MEMGVGPTQNIRTQHPRRKLCLDPMEAAENEKFSKFLYARKKGNYGRKKFVCAHLQVFFDSILLPSNLLLLLFSPINNFYFNLYFESSQMNRNQARCQKNTIYVYIKRKILMGWKNLYRSMYFRCSQRQRVNGVSNEFSLNAHAVMHSDDFSFLVDIFSLVYVFFFAPLFRSLLRQSFSHLLCNVLDCIEYWQAGNRRQWQPI